MDDVRDGDPGHRVKLDVPADVGDGLEHDATDGGVLESKLDDGSDLVGVHVALDGRDEDGGHAGICEAVEGTHLGFQQRFAAYGAIGFLAQSVELEINDGIEGSHPGQEFVIVSESHAVGVDHHLANAPVLSGLNHLGQLRVDGGFPAAELDHLGVTLDFDESVKHGLNLFQGEAVADAGVGETDRTVQVAGGVDLDECQADVLLVLRAEPAVQGAAVLNLCAEIQRDGAGLVETHAADVHLGVRADNPLEPTVFGAALPHIDLVVADDYLRVDNRLAFRANGAGELVKYEIGVLLGMASCGQLRILLELLLVVFRA